jgi:hypothetical protein
MAALTVADGDEHRSPGGDGRSAHAAPMKDLVLVTLDTPRQRHPVVLR